MGINNDSIWEVHKFGGTSVANAECFLRVAQIVEEQQKQPPFNNQQEKEKQKQICVVVSAMGGKPKVTDLLLSSVSAAAQRQDDEVDLIMKKILTKHADCLDALDSIPTDEKERLKGVVEVDIRNIRDILKTVSLMKWEASRISELVAGYGEQWSAQILASLLEHRAREHDIGFDSASDPIHRFKFLDARRVIIVEEENEKMGQAASGNGSGGILWETCAQNLKEVYKNECSNDSSSDTSRPIITHFVATGYIASSSNGVSTTLGRDGSDYSASIFGRLFQSDIIAIWTDVDGVLSADPRRVPNAHVLPDVSFNEAMELAYFGAKVIHPKTMIPAILANPQIPIYIRNTFNSSFRGSRIFTSSTTHMDRDRCVCGFSTVEDISLINVEGSGMVGVPGVAKRLFGTLQQNSVNVILIAQASSEHSITFATMSSKADIAKEAIEEEFAKELRLSHISAIDVISPCSIIAAVGDGMGHTTGVSGRFFSALGDAKINVMAMAQGCSERNISAVILTSESTRALRAVHAAFRLSQTTVRVGIIISDELGFALLDLLHKQRNKIRATFDIDVQVCAVVCRTDKSVDKLFILENNGVGGQSLDTESIKSVIEETFSGTSNVSDSNQGPKAVFVDGGFQSMNDYVISEDVAHSIIFDCTGEESVGKFHPGWLKKGIHVITANSTCLSGSRQLRDELDHAERFSGKLSASYLREVTVGGGLPIIGTIRNLLNSGDRIHKIDGIFSVSLSYIMYRVAPPSLSSACFEFDQEIGGVFHQSDDTNEETFKKFENPCTFDQAVQEAIVLGLMERDPFCDLTNEYIGRSLMVLAKELGLDQSYNVKKIQLNSDTFVHYAKTSVEDENVHVLKAAESESIDDVLSRINGEMEKRVTAAAQKNCVPRYISSIDVMTKNISIKLVDVPESHMFATTPPSCECVRFFTKRHKRYPLVIKGPSEGADCTSSALLAEMLHLMHGKVGVRSGNLARSGSSVALS